ncbi:MAG: DUF3237 domain-containing protein [Betaproteobacteria bacterium]
MLRLEPLLTAQISLAAPQELGETPLGRRRIINITGGTFRGARLSGRVLPGGADWQVIRPDGVADLDARHTLQTDDGAPEVLQKLAAGVAVDPDLYYLWLNRMVCVGTGERRADSVKLDFFEVK